MPFVPPVLLLMRQEADGHDVLTYLSGNVSPYGPPMAPAGLYDVIDQGAEVFPLHKVVRSAPESQVFKTFDVSPLPAGAVGRKVVFRPWWTQRAWNLVTDTSLHWQYALYPDDGSHAHCELTYVGIGSSEEHKDGYFTGDHWVTCEAYERFVRDDVYHCRNDG